MKSISERLNFKDLLIIVVGTFMMAVAISFAFDPIGLDAGGVTGLSIVIKHALFRQFGFELPIWFANLAFNIPLFAMAIWKKGFKYVAKTGFATLMLSAWLAVLPVQRLLADTLLATIFGGVLSGLGIGLVLSTGSTTGGSDLFASLIHDRWRFISIPKLLMVTDGVIVMLGVFVFGLESVLYSIVVVYVVAKISDGILEGLKFAKMAYIISDSADAIAADIMTAVDRGATGINVKGMFSGEERKMLFCVVGKKQIVELIDIVNRYDKKAFMVIADAREVLGEGFAEVKNVN